MEALQFVNSWVAAEGTATPGTSLLAKGRRAPNQCAFEELPLPDQNRLALANDVFLLRLPPDRQRDLLATLYTAGRHARVNKYPALLVVLSVLDRRAYASNPLSGLRILLDHLEELSDEDQDHVLRFVSNPENLGDASPSISAALEEIVERATKAVTANERVRRRAALAQNSLSAIRN